MAAPAENLNIVMGLPVREWDEWPGVGAVLNLECRRSRYGECRSCPSFFTGKLGGTAAGSESDLLFIHGGVRVCLPRLHAVSFRCASSWHLETSLALDLGLRKIPPIPFQSSHYMHRRQPSKKSTRRRRMNRYSKSIRAPPLVSIRT